MLAKKILNVMKKVGPVIKDKTNQEKGFDYVSLANIIIKAREAMIEEKIIMIPNKVEQIVQNGKTVVISMIYTFFDAEPNEKGENERLDVNIAGEGCDEDGWGIYKALSGAYKYAVTQTFAIPTIDDAERSKLTNDMNNENTEEQSIIQNGSLNENEIEKILGDQDEAAFEKLFSLNNNVA